MHQHMSVGMPCRTVVYTALLDGYAGTDEVEQPQGSFGEVLERAVGDKERTRVLTHAKMVASRLRQMAEVYDIARLLRQRRNGFPNLCLRLHGLAVGHCYPNLSCGIFALDDDDFLLLRVAANLVQANNAVGLGIPLCHGGKQAYGGQQTDSDQLLHVRDCLLFTVYC